MRTPSLLIAVIFFLIGCEPAQAPPEAHPDSSQEGWEDLFAPDLSNAIYTQGVWQFDDGILSPEEDEEIWTRATYADFVVDLEFRNGSGTNSGVIIHADIDDWVPNSIEVQIADDYHEMWGNAPATWQCGAIFGHVAPRTRAVRPPGEWNRMTVTSRDRHIRVLLNGEVVSEMEMDEFTSAETNPDGSEIPAWLSIPKADLPASGHIGLQGKHGEAPVWFRNLRIRRLSD